MQVLARVEEELRVEVPLRGLFESPTVATLAAAVVGRLAETMEDGLVLEMLAELDGEARSAEVLS
jgi:hypothetical protein